MISEAPDFLPTTAGSLQNTAFEPENALFAALSSPGTSPTQTPAFSLRASALYQP
jgi:hypothetical protein